MSYGLLDLDGLPTSDFPTGGPPPASGYVAYGTTTVGPMPIEPGRADASGSKLDGSVGGQPGKSHRIDVVAPGAIHVQVQQVNWPDLPQELPVVRIAEDRFQTRTKGVVPAPGGQQHRNMVAYIFVRATYPDGQVVYHPPLDRLITYEEVAQFPIRPGLQPGNRRPRVVGKTQVITLSAPAAGGAGTSEVDSGVDVALTDDTGTGTGTGTGGVVTTTTTTAAASGINPWVVGVVVVGAGALGWFVLRALGVLGQRAPSPSPWWPATPRWPV